MGNQQFAFIYYRRGEYKLLSLEESLEQDESLKNDNWIHSSTIDPLVLLQHQLTYFPEDFKKIMVVIGI
jgi:hypothetical protein